MSSLFFQIPTEAERLIVDREMRSKHEMLWRAKTEHLVDDLEAAKLSIHNLMQENLNLKVTIQQNSEETQRIQEEAKVKFEAKIHQLESQNESLIKQPQITKLQREIACMTQENYRLKHQSKVVFGFLLIQLFDFSAKIQTILLFR